MSRSHAAHLLSMLRAATPRCAALPPCRYPQIVQDLVGWHVRSFACGPGTFACAADNSVITWGAATNGELGYGPNKKSSANPAKV